MKKYIYILLLSIVSISVSSCTEEEVAPKSELKKMGGQPDDPR